MYRHIGEYILCHLQVQLQAWFKVMTKAHLQLKKQTCFRIMDFQLYIIY